MLAFVIARVTHKLKVWRARFGYPQGFQIFATRLPQAVARVSACVTVDVYRVVPKLRLTMLTHVTTQTPYKL